jgi:Holliday junction resolvasome RuvABC DNA-binding subunit
MNKPIVVFHNVKTNEIIEREMNNKEFAQWELDQVAEAARQAEQDAKAAAKESALTKLQALGLSEAEIRALVGA